MKNARNKIQLLNLYWLIHIAIYVYLFFVQENQISVFLALYITIAFSFIVLAKNIVIRAISSISLCLYALFFLYETVYKSFISGSENVFIVSIIVIVNTLNFLVPLMTLLLMAKPNKQVERSKIVQLTLGILIFIIAIWCIDAFYLRDIEARKHIARGEEIVAEITDFESRHNRLPISLEELNIDNGDSFSYELDTITNNYLLLYSFEYSFNRRNKKSATRIMSCETVTYDSRSKKWTQD